ncbi:hypothetical protein [Pseudoalteromonas sp. SWN166]|uniref:hypothetical protein n=1 Tax=Pseudoalteromonas sp. SWN166 TaxID=2792061 RepID=UPI0018CD24A6|nr:hypothetical protein [Pseudoalteromonas sp. SWN166]MBH0040436.1 hypothetical protein [Pseudoalteromonas sp. SWN166]
MNYKNVNFDLYRYQLLPITQNIQPDLYREILTKEELKRKKNILFHEVISKLPNMVSNSGNSLQQKIVLNTESWFAFKLGTQKTIEIENENFNRELVDNWPHVTVIIDNRSDRQLIAISKNSRAFSSTRVVAKIIKESLKNHLANLQLSMHIEAIFEEKCFWKLINKNRGKVTSIKFELISPNMANISKSLKVDLKQINIDTNSHKTCLELNADDNASLEIQEDNEVIDGLVEYASKGGGDIVLKVNGIKRSIRTKQSIKTIEIDELTVESLNAESLEILLGALS